MSKKFPTFASTYKNAIPFLVVATISSLITVITSKLIANRKPLNSAEQREVFRILVGKRGNEPLSFEEVVNQVKKTR